MYIMAKTIMISDDVYKKLKIMKEREDKSYSNVIINLMENKRSKTFTDLKKYFGVLKEDKEYDEILKETRKAWKKWTESYA